MNSWIQVDLNLLEPLTRPLVAKISDRAVPVNFFLGVSHRVFQKSTAIIVLVEHSDPARDEIQNFHLFYLILFFFPLRLPFVGSQLVDIKEDLLFLSRVQVCKHLMNILAIFDQIIFLGVMKKTHEPGHMVVSDCLILDLFGHAGNSEWVGCCRLSLRFIQFSQVDQFVELPSSFDCEIVPQVVAVLFFDILHISDVNQASVINHLSIYYL